MVDGPFGGMVDGGPILVPGTRLAKRRLWDEHLRHLGYPPKFYRVQDAISGNHSSFLHDFKIILMKIINNNVLAQKSLSKKKKRPLPGCWSQSSGVGMHPQMPPFSKLGNWQIQNLFNEKQSKTKEVVIGFALFPLFGSIAGVI